MSAQPYLTYVLLFLILLTDAVTTKAQQSLSVANPYSQVSIASPTVASLGKYADIPVNYHTGIPQISVPLYTIQEGALTLPISLSYHAGGVKVQEPASWVGTGWALNAGGVITRTVLGAPDESGTSNTTKGHFSDYGYSNYLMTGAVVGNGSTMRPGPNDAAIANAIYDGEPDLFFFNFNGYSGKFFFSDDRTPVVVDGQDLKIEYYYPRESNPTSSSTLADNNIQGFIITIPTGDKYYFGITDGQPYGRSSQDQHRHDGDKPVEMTYTDYGNSPGVDNNIYSSYYLSKIVAADGIHTIHFSYQRETYSYYTLLMNPSSPTLYVDPRDLANNPTLNTRPKFVHLAKQNIDGVRLAKITFSTGSVTFLAATTPRTDLSSYLEGGLAEFPNKEAKALDNVQISASDFCKQFTFTYSYFGGDNTPLASSLLTPDGSPIQTDKFRLKLESVLEKSCDGTVAANPWKFTYNGTFLPRRLSYAQDHWGFYNGALTNNQLNTLIPTYYYESADGDQLPDSEDGSVEKGANRDPDAQATAAGVLTQITYPTGGMTVFEYEPNDVWTAYTKYEYKPPFTTVVNAQWSTNYWNNYTFNAGVGTYYRITVDYQRDKSCVFSGSASAIFSDGNTITVAASSDFPRAQRLVRPVAGTRRITFDLHSSCRGDQASLSIEEITKRYVQENALAGGLRIKTITAKKDAQAPGLVTSYTYREATGHSSGMLFTRPRYVQVVRNDLLAQLGFSADGSPNTSNLTPNGCLGPEFPNNKQGYLKSPCNILPMATTQGNHIGYSRVTVRRSGSGRTEYRYYGSNDQSLDTPSDLGRTYGDVCYRTINRSVCDPKIPSLPAPPARFEFNRGQLAAEISYNEQNQLVKQLQYTYQYDSSRIVTPAYMSRYVAQALLGGTYERKGYWKKQASVVETAYSSMGQPFTKRQVFYYSSPYHHQLTRQSETTSTGDVLETQLQYALDLSVPASSSLDDGTAAYTQACRTCDATYGKDYTLCPTMGCKFDAYIAHVVCRVNARQAYVVYRRQNFTNSTNTFRTAHNAAKNSADAVLKPLLQLQDDNNNAPVETSQWKNGRLLSATYTVFGPSLTPGGTMYPSKVFSLPLATPSATFAPATINGNSIRIDNRYQTKPETTLRFDKGNLVEVIPKGGPVTSYVWGYNDALPILKALGVDQATLNAAYRRAGGDLATMRSAPELAKALVSTYAYRPLVGMTSQTDPSGRTTNYEYDALGRLLRTRDEQGRLLSENEYRYAQP